MSQSLSCVIIHLVFSTKSRIPLISLQLEKRLKPTLQRILQSEGCDPIAVGCSDDHVHTLSYLSRTVTISGLVGRVKGLSSSWVHNSFRMRRKFAWQAGYAAFSVSPSKLKATANYVENQREHHRHRGFQEEVRELLRIHDVKFDERYLWD